MTEKPLVYTLCGSSRFPEAFALVNLHLSLQGAVVISLGMFGHADKPEGARFLTSDGDEKTPEKQRLDELHFRKIDLSDAIFVVNPGGYIGSSTTREIAYARERGKAVEWLFPPPEERVGYVVDQIEQPCQACSGSGMRGPEGGTCSACGGSGTEWVRVRGRPIADEEEMLLRLAAAMEAARSIPRLSHSHDAETIAAVLESVLKGDPGDVDPATFNEDRREMLTEHGPRLGWGRSQISVKAEPGE